MPEATTAPEPVITGERYLFRRQTGHRSWRVHVWDVAAGRPLCSTKAQAWQDCERELDLPEDVSIIEVACYLCRSVAGQRGLVLTRAGLRNPHDLTVLRPGGREESERKEVMTLEETEKQPGEGEEPAGGEEPKPEGGEEPKPDPEEAE